MTKFKEGDKVEVFQDGSTNTAWVGAKGIVKELRSYGGYYVELTDVAKTSEKVGYVAYLTGSNLKLIEEPALTLDGFTVGDKVRYTGSLWKNLEGVVSSINGNLLDIRVTKLHDNPTYTSLRVGKTLVEACGGQGINTHSLVKIEETKPFTFKDIQKGDTIRRTRTYKSGAKEVREGTVSKVGNDYVTEGENTFILAYGSDTTRETVTLELLNRPEPEPEPEPVKAVWEDAKPGTVITRGRDHLILNEKGWLVLYSDGSTQQFEKDSADVLVNYDSKVLAPTS